MASVFWDIQGIIQGNYLSKGQTINSDYFINILIEKLHPAIKEKRRGKIRKGILLYMDNARPHTAHKSIAKIHELGYETLPHPLYSPDLAPSDFALFPTLKKILKGNHYSSRSAIGNAVYQWVRGTPPEWYESSYAGWVERSKKCLAIK